MIIHCYTLQSSRNRGFDTAHLVLGGYRGMGLLNPTDRATMFGVGWFVYNPIL